MNGTPRTRNAALLLSTGAVVLVFVVIFLVNPLSDSGRPGPPSGVGAVIFAALLTVVWLRGRDLPGVAGAGQTTVVQRRALIVMAVVLWLMGGLFWYFVGIGLPLRFGVHPVLLAVPLTIYPALLVLGAKPPHTTNLKGSTRPKAGEQ